MAIILDGKLVADKIKKDIRERVKKLIDENQRLPALAVILASNDEAAKIYVNREKKVFYDVGLPLHVNTFDSNISEAYLIEKIELLNKDNTVDGIIVQLPLPNHIDEKKVIRAIEPAKDVDGVHPFNMGLTFMGDDAFTPCTPAGIIKLLDEYNIDLTSKKAVIVGRSNIVGKPLFSLLLKRNATVTICHSKTLDLQKETITADILISAIGRSHFIKDFFVKEGAVVIDVGINYTDGKIVGDVDFDSVNKKASYITPVPGGVGPMTMAMLISNTIKAYNHHN